jgi:hypothetical protein
MTENEKKLLETIRNHPEPEQAVEIAIKTILAFLGLHESSQEPSLVCSRESA